MFGCAPTLGSQLPNAKNTFISFILVFVSKNMSKNKEKSLKIPKTNILSSSRIHAAPQSGSKHTALSTGTWTKSRWDP